MIMYSASYINIYLFQNKAVKMMERSLYSAHFVFVENLHKRFALFNNDFINIVANNFFIHLSVW